MLLYRGQQAHPGSGLPDWIVQSEAYRQQAAAADRWFTDELEIAQWYANDAGYGDIVSVDVPDDVAIAAWLPNQPLGVKRYSLDPTHEWFLPHEWAERASVKGGR